VHKLMIGTAAGLCLVTGTALAVDADKTILCAVTQVEDCIVGGGCETVQPEDVNAPTFLRVNLKKNEIVVRPSQPPTKIEHREQVENRLMLQGAEDGNENRPDGVGWTLSIGMDTGRFVAAIAATDASITLFGACTEI
jgi:hypothetical protein